MKRMISEYRVRNFRAFSEEVVLDDLGKINLVVGPNNVGKTALLLPLRRMTRMDRAFAPLQDLREGEGMMIGSSYNTFGSFDAEDHRAQEEIQVGLTICASPELGYAASKPKRVDFADPEFEPLLDRVTIALVQKHNGKSFQAQLGEPSVSEVMAALAKVTPVPPETGPLSDSSKADEAKRLADSVAAWFASHVSYVPLSPAARSPALTLPSPTGIRERQFDIPHLMRAVLAWTLPSGWPP